MTQGPIDARIQAHIEQTVTDMIFGMDRLDVEQEIHWLTIVVIQNRQMLITERIHNRLQAMALRFTGEARFQSQVQAVSRVLNERQIWFEARIIDAIDPIDVFKEWMRTLKDRLSRVKLADSPSDSFLFEEDDLPAHPQQDLE